MAQINLRAVLTAQDEASAVLAGFSSGVDSLGNKLAKVGKVATVALGATLVTGLALGTKAAFDQVKAVEEASFALRAYERDGAKVNQILSELVQFARSDMGVLFQREELFKAASNLRGFGDAADKITDHVKILSRGVALGMTNFDELSQIIGRVTQSGQLSAEAFDQLAYRGIILNSSLRGTSISADALYKALANALPEDILAGRANTIQGHFIRFQSALRDVGATILGVDKTTSTFAEGGLGDRFVKGVGAATDALRKFAPEISSGFQAVFDITGKVASSLGTALRSATDSLTPSLGKLWDSIANKLLPSLERLWTNVLQPMLPVLGVAFVAALQAVTLGIDLLVQGISAVANVFADHPVLSAAGLGAIAVVIGGALVGAFIAWAAAATGAAIATVAATWPILAIGAAVGVLAYLVTTNWASIVGAFEAAGNFIGEKLTWLKDHFFEAVGFIIGYFATLPIKIPFLVATALISAIQFIGSINWGGVFGSIGAFFAQAMETVKNAAVSAWNFIKNIKWGDVLINIGKGIGNAIMGLIEGALNGAFAGIPGSPKVKLPRLATGTDYFQGGMALVGERGPELVTMPRGSSVTPNNQLGSIGGNTTINVTFSGVFTGNEMEFRKLAVKVFESAKDAAGAKNKNLMDLVGG